MMKIGKKPFFNLTKEVLILYDEQYKQKMREFFTLLYENPISCYRIFNIPAEKLENLYKIAAALYQQGRYKEAIPLFHLLILANVGEPRYTMGLASCHHMLKEYQKASFLYTLCALFEPENPIYPYHASDCYIEQNDPFSAMVALEQAITTAKDQTAYQLVKKRSQLTLTSLKKQLKEEAREKVEPFHRDFLHETLTTFDSVNQKMQALMEVTEQTAETKKAFATLAEEMHILNTRFKKLYSSHELSILFSYLDAAELLSQCQAMGQGSPKLLIGLSLLFRTADTYTGKELKKVLHAIPNALMVFLPPRLNEGTKQMLNLTTQAFVSGALFATLFAKNKGIGEFKQPDLNIEDANLFSFELLTHLFLHARMLRDAFGGFVPYFTKDKGQQALITTSIELITTLLTLFAISDNKPSVFEGLLESVGDYLQKDLTEIDQQLMQASLGKESIRPLAILLQQAKINVDKGKWQEVRQNCEELLKHLQLTKDKLHHDIQEMGNTLDVLLKNIWGEKADELANFPLNI